MATSLIAGLLSGIAGLLVFLTIHHFWIKPIWFILPPGLVIAALGGLAVGWSYAEIKTGLPPRPWTAFAVFALVGATLVPAILLAQLRPPPLDISTGTILNGTVASVIARFVLELLLTASIVGGLAGWWLGHTQRAAFATGTISPKPTVPMTPKLKYSAVKGSMRLPAPGELNAKASGDTRPRNMYALAQRMTNIK